MAEDLQELLGPALGKLGVLLDEIRLLVAVLVAQEEEEEAPPRGPR